MIVQHGRIPWQILTDIRTAAVEYATHGWPIQPGTYQLTGSPRWHGRPGVIGMVPVHDDWPIADRVDPDLALNLWTIRPYSILIACGTAFDAVEVPAAFGPNLTELLREGDCLPPMITTPSDTWILLTSTVDPLAVCTDFGILTHSTGSLIALPSAPDAHLGHRWRIHPRSVGWAIPHSSQVLQAIDKATTQICTR